MRLILFLVCLIVMPVVFIACIGGSCGWGGNGDSEFRTYSALDTRFINE